MVYGTIKKLKTIKYEKSRKNLGKSAQQYN